MHEFTVWRDWLRVEDCLLYGIRRWAVAVIALWAVHNWLDDWLAGVVAGAVIVAQVRYMRWSDSKTAAAEAESYAEPT